MPDISTGIVGYSIFKNKVIGIFTAFVSTVIAKGM
jgi:hypothetical protein